MLFAVQQHDIDICSHVSDILMGKIYKNWYWIRGIFYAFFIHSIFVNPRFSDLLIREFSEVCDTIHRQPITFHSHSIIVIEKFIVEKSILPNFYSISIDSVNFSCGVDNSMKSYQNFIAQQSRLIISDSF